MTQCELPKEELVRRKELSDNTRKMIYSLLDVAAEDETSLMTTYRDFYLQISFSELHPLMVFYLARPLDGEKAMLADRSNEMNLRSVLGSHSVNENFSCYGGCCKQSPRLYTLEIAGAASLHAHEHRFAFQVQSILLSVH